MTVTNASAAGPQMSPEEADKLMSARERMVARHKLIEGMIQNNERQLKNESQRGGAEIERASALRDAATNPAARAEVDALDSRLRALADEQQRLITERGWLNTSLLEFEQEPSAHRPSQTGHA